MTGHNCTANNALSLLGQRGLGSGSLSRVSMQTAARKEMHSRPECSMEPLEKMVFLSPYMGADFPECNGETKMIPSLGGKLYYEELLKEFNHVTLKKKHLPGICL